MAKIGSINDLKDLGGGIYQRTYVPANSQRGFVTSDNNVLSQTWDVSARFKFATGWKWGSTPYGGSDQSFANCKIFRMWNPGSTKENCYVELTGYEGSNGTAKFVIEDASGNQAFQKYFFDGFKSVLSGGSDHVLRFQFHDSDAGSSNGTFKAYLDGALIAGADVQGFKSRVSGGLKRVFCLGLESEWGSNAGNTLTLSEISMSETGLPAPTPIPTPTPTPIPTPAPVPVPPAYPADFKLWWNARPIKGDLP